MVPPNFVQNISAYFLSLVNQKFLWFYVIKEYVLLGKYSMVTMITKYYYSSLPLGKNQLDDDSLLVTLGKNGLEDKIDYSIYILYRKDINF